MRRLTAMILALLLMLTALSACGASNNTENNTSSENNTQTEETNKIPGLATDGVLRVGMECAYAPFNWTQASESDTTMPIADGSGYCDGYDVQIAKQLADYLGVELEIYAIEWDGLPSALMSSKVDAIIAGMSPTEQRRVTLDFSQYYWESTMCLVTKADSKYASATSLADLAGATLCAQADTSHYEVLSQAKEQGAKILPAMEGFPQLNTALIAGAIDGYTCETPSAEAAIAANPSLSYIPNVGFEFDPVDVSTAIAVRKGSGLDAKIDEFLATISADTRLDMMSDAVQRQPLSE